MIYVATSKSGKLRYLNIHLGRPREGISLFYSFSKWLNIGKISDIFIHTCIFMSDHEKTSEFKSDGYP